MGYRSVRSYPLVLCGVFAVASVTTHAQRIDEPWLRETDEDKAEKILQLVAGLPPNLACYFGLLSLDQVKARPIRRELLDHLASFARSAEPPYKTAYMGPPERSLTSLSASVKQPPTDRLSLQLAVLNRMAEIDRSRASELLEDIFIKISSGNGCEVVIVPSLTSSYREIGRLTGILFDLDSEEQASRRGHILLRFANDIKSSYQLTGLVELANDSSVPDNERILVVAAVTRALETINDGDPAFTTALIQDALPNAIASLVKTVAAKGYLAGALLSAYRRYLVTNARQRCGHLVALEKQVLRLPSHNYIQLFNDLVENLCSQGMLGRGDIEPLKTLSSEMRVLGVSPKTALAFESEPPRKLLKSIGELTDQRAGSSSRDEYGLSRADWEKLAGTVVTNANEYTHSVLSEQRSGDEALQLSEIGHILSLLLDVVDVPNEQEKVAETYARAIGSLWRVGVDDGLYHAHLRGLILKCWGEGVDGDTAAALRQARLRGVRSGLLGQPAMVSKVADLTLTLEAAPETCSVLR